MRDARDLVALAIEGALFSGRLGEAFCRLGDLLLHEGRDFGSLLVRETAIAKGVRANVITSTVTPMVARPDNAAAEMDVGAMRIFSSLVS